MNQNHTTTDFQTATSIIRQNLNQNLSVLAVQPLHGGMVNRVEKWLIEGKPSAVVAKLTPEPNHQGLKNEFKSLKYYRQNTSFPVPLSYACVTDNNYFSGTCLLIEAVRGVNLSEAKLTPTGMHCFQRQLAQILTDLHSHTRDTFGSALEPVGPKHWLQIFGPQIESNFSKSSPRLSPSVRRTIEKMISNLDQWLPEHNNPTLVHGDIWATNIMVDDTDPDKPYITAFLDVSALYADVEYELAYLRIFHTADETFFSEYIKTFPLRPGFERRCLLYWLNTMMLHVAVFGNAYLSSCENIAKRISSLS
ncbi:MAG: fructosamine kinase family protein [Planctomycetota bacterium]|jgi:fructosamine-3-kinase